MLAPASAAIVVASALGWPIGSDLHHLAIQTPDDPAPVGSPFEYADGLGSTAWIGTVLGLVDLPRSDSSVSGAAGRCVGIIGTVTPTATAGLTAQPFSTPPLSIVSGGRAVESTDSLSECDDAALEDAGWGVLFDAAVTAGTQYPFVEPVFLAGEPAPEPQLIAVGDTSSPGATY